MSRLYQFLASPGLQTAGWVLINFVWQAVLVALLLRAALVLVRPGAAVLRYRLALSAFFLLAALPAVSFWKAHHPSQPAAASQSANPGAYDTTGLALQDPGSGSGIRPAPQQARIGGAKGQIERVLSWVSLGWILGTIALWLKTVGGLIQTRRLRRTAVKLPQLGGTEELGSIAARLSIGSPVSILESARVSVPTTVGWRRPAILLPSGVAEKLDRLTVANLIAHELAHIRRRDYAINFLQISIEDLFFFHPAVWWISARARVEREHCCDDDAVAICGDALGYARALAQAERFRSESPVALALGSGPLLNRIRRITEMNEKKAYRSSIVFAAVTGTVLIAAAGTAAAVLAYVPAQAQPATRQRGGVQQGTPAGIVGTVPGGVAVGWQQGTVRGVVGGVPGGAGGAVPKDGADSTGNTGVKGKPAAEQPIDWGTARQIAAPIPVTRKVVGKIYDPTGALMARVRISVYIKGSGQALSNATSDERGQFEIMVPEGPQYEVRFEYPGFKAYTTAPPQSSPDAPLTIRMRLGEIVESVRIMAAAGTARESAGQAAPIRLHGGIRPPELVSRVEPIYPPEALEQRINGTVIVRALIDTDGAVKDAAVVGGPPIFENAVLTAVRQWRYTPTVLNGEPWPTWVTVSLTFEVR